MRLATRVCCACRLGTLHEGTCVVGGGGPHDQAANVTSRPRLWRRGRACQQPGLRVGVVGHVDGWAALAFGATGLLVRIQPVAARRDEVVWQVLVAADTRAGPGVDEVVGEQLPEELGAPRSCRSAAGPRPSTRPPGWYPRGWRRRRGACGERVATETVALEPVADVVGGLARQQWRRPQLLVDDVVDPVADRPVGARSRSVEMCGVDAGEAVAERGERAVQQSAGSVVGVMGGTGWGSVGAGVGGQTLDRFVHEADRAAGSSSVELDDDVGDALPRPRDTRWRGHGTGRTRCGGGGLATSCAVPDAAQAPDIAGGRRYR